MAAALGRPGVSAAGGELSRRSLEALGSPFSPPLSVTPPRLLPAATRQPPRARLSDTELFLPRGLPGASAGGREAGRHPASTGPEPRLPAAAVLIFFTRISPCGRSGAETFPARSPASLGRVKQPFYGHHTPRTSPPTPEQNLAALGAPPTRHSQHRQLRGGRARGLPPAAIGRRLSRSAMRLVSSARRAGRDYQRFREPGASWLGREVRVAMPRLRAGAAGGHTVRDL